MVNSYEIISANRAYHMTKLSDLKAASLVDEFVQLLHTLAADVSQRISDLLVLNSQDYKQIME
jgi:hypothetical protein